MIVVLDDSDKNINKIHDDEMNHINGVRNFSQIRKWLAVEECIIVVPRRIGGKKDNRSEIQHNPYIVRLSGL